LVTNNKAAPDPILMRPSEVAAALGLSRSMVTLMVARGELPVVRFGKAVRIPREDLERLLEERKERAVA
jgi:excisionase family DNA binding protein